MAVPWLAVGKLVLSNLDTIIGVVKPGFTRKKVDGLPSQTDLLNQQIAELQAAGSRTLVIVSGEGVIWNEHSRAPVRPGDVIFFPRKHVHSLQCTSPDGMDVVGMIHPGENPGINY